MAKETCQDFLKFSRGFPEPHDNLLAKMVCQPNWFWLQNFHGFCQPKWFLATKFSRGFPEPHDDLLAKMVCQPNWFWLQNFHGFCQPNWFWLQNFHGFCQPKWFLATKFSRGFARQNGFWLHNFHGFCQPKWVLATNSSRVCWLKKVLATKLHRLASQAKNKKGRKQFLDFSWHKEIWLVADTRSISTT